MIEKIPGFWHPYSRGCQIFLMTTLTTVVDYWIFGNGEAPSSNKWRIFENKCFNPQIFKY